MALELTQEQKDAGWQVKQIREIATVVTGGTPSKNNPEYWGDSTPFLTPSDQVFGVRQAVTSRFLSVEGRESFSRRVVDSGAIAITCIGATIGKVSYIQVPTVTNQQINSLAADEKQAHGLYLYYLFTTLPEELYAIASGSATPIVSKSVLENFEVAIPSYADQKRIAEILGSVDDKIEANSRLIQSLTELVDAQVIKANEYAAETIKVSDLAVHSREQILPSKSTDGTVLHYSLPAFDAGAVPAKEEAELILSNKFVLSKPVVLFSKLNPGTPRIWMVEPDAERFNFASTEFVVLEPKEGMGLGALWAACRDPRVSQKLSEFARGTSSSHQRVSPKDILESSVVVADIPEEETTLIRKLTDENVSLAQTRDFLIRYLIG